MRGNRWPLGVCRHLNRGVTEPRLHHLERQLESAVVAAVDAPRGVEVSEAVGRYTSSLGIDEASRAHPRVIRELYWHGQKLRLDVIAGPSYGYTGQMRPR
jgi:hypothetical protein